MSEQERPRTEAGRRLVDHAMRIGLIDVRDQVVAIEAEGRQQAVREIRAEISKGLQGDVQAALDRLAGPPMAHRGHDEGRSHPECIACQRVAGLNASESPLAHMRQSGNGCVTCTRRWSDHTAAERGDASESPPTQPKCLRCGALWVHRDDYAGLGTPHPYESGDASESGQLQEASDE